MIYLKSESEISLIREGGQILSAILGHLADMVEPGVTTDRLDAEAERMMRQAGGEPAFKGYRSGGASRPFPTTICASINGEVVHGPAAPGRALKSGDLIKLDVGLRYRELYTDMAATVGVGEISKEAKRLIGATKEALNIAIAQVRDGAWISDVGRAVDKYVRRQGFSTVKDLVGHGVGKYVHEEPQIPNFLDRSLEPVLIETGMVLALEPMVNAGDDAVRVMSDGWTVVTADGSLSAHFEATVAVTGKGVEIMTPLLENV
jgi:methionyl aminopeptidase